MDYTDSEQGQYEHEKECWEDACERWAFDHTDGEMMTCCCGKQCRLDESETLSPNPYAIPVCPDCFEKACDDKYGPGWREKMKVCDSGVVRIVGREPQRNKPPKVLCGTGETVYWCVDAVEGGKSFAVGSDELEAWNVKSNDSIRRNSE